MADLIWSQSNYGHLWLWWPSVASVTVTARFPTRRGQHSSSSRARHVWQQWVLNTYESFCSIFTDDAVVSAVSAVVVVLVVAIVVIVGVAHLPLYLGIVHVIYCCLTSFLQPSPLCPQNLQPQRGLSKYLYLYLYICICICSCISVRAHCFLCVWQIFVGNHLLCSVKRRLSTQSSVISVTPNSLSLQPEGLVAPSPNQKTPK